MARWNIRLFQAMPRPFAKVRDSTCLSKCSGKQENKKQRKTVGWVEHTVSGAKHNSKRGVFGGKQRIISEQG